MASDAVDAPALETSGPAEVAEPDVEIVDDTPMAPPEQLETLAEDAEETREEDQE